MDTKGQRGELNRKNYLHGMNADQNAEKREAFHKELRQNHRVNQFNRRRAILTNDEELRKIETLYDFQAIQCSDAATLVSVPQKLLQLVPEIG